MAIDNLTASLTAAATWTAQKNQTGTDYPPLGSSGTISKKLTMGTAAVNNTAGGADEFVSFLQTLLNSASASIDLTNLTDIVQASGISLARVKGIMIRLLSTTDDATYGTASNSVLVDGTVTNALSSQSNTGWFGNAGEGTANGSRVVIPNGGFLAFGTPAALGVLVDGTHKIIKVTNQDAGVPAKVQISLIGGTS